MKASLPYLEKQLDEIKKSLWHGCLEYALSEIQKISTGVNDSNQFKIIDNLYQYIFDNKEYIVDYDKRKNEKLPYTSHVAESTVEHLLNDRCKRKQKMQWSRKGLHAVIQIRVSQASGDWDVDWKNIIKPQLQVAA